jgi:uncharacterized RDD family membrane protein YckC
MPQDTIFCPRCGQSNLAGGAFCEKCGASLIPAAVPASVAVAGPVPVVYAVNPYGGFWIRVLAYFIDRIVVGILLAPFCVVFGLRMAHLHHSFHHDPAEFAPIIHLGVAFALMALAVQWLYEALLTSSSWQATVGKRVLNLKVTDEFGNPISFEKATGRFFAKIISSLTLCIGYLMVAFTARKQGLHDMLARTLVMKTDTFAGS